MTAYRMITALAFALGLGSEAGAYETRLLTLTHDGLERRAIVDAAPDLRNAPVLMALHGGLAGPRTVRRKAQVRLARDGWVVVWPYAVDDWNDGRTDFEGEPYDSADDIGFLRKLVEALAERGIADPTQVYVAGPSIGGIMALRLMCDAPDLVAGVAVAIASFAEDYWCRSGPAKPVLFIHSTEDPLVPPDGGRIGGWNPLVRDRGRVMPAERAMSILSTRNGCAAYEEDRLPDIAPDDGSTVLRRRYTGCQAPLVHYLVEGGGHTWPGAEPSRLGERIVGTTNRDFSATRAVETFFRGLAGR